MKNLILVITLIFTNLVSAEEDKSNEKEVAKTLVKMFEVINIMPDKEEIDELSKQWNSDFVEHLQNHESADINLYGLQELSLKYYGFKKQKIINPNDLTDFANDLRNLVDSNELSTQSLFIASGICSGENIIDYCDSTPINKKLIQSEPNNVLVYFPSLKKALENNKTDEVNQLLNQMAHSEFANNYSSIPELLEDTIDEYTRNHPYHEKMINSELTAIESLKKISPEKIQEIREDFFYYQSYMYKIHFKLIYPMITMRSLMDVCKSDMNLAKTCLKISDILISKNKSIISPMVGYTVKIDTLKLIGEENLASETEIIKAKLKKQYECLMRIKSSNNNQIDLYLNPEDFKKLSTIERNQGELALFKTMAETSYQQQLDLGNENAINPQTCFEK